MLLPLLQDTPNTVPYLVLGYLVLIGLPVLYVLSWLVRRRNLERDLELIETLEREEQAKKAAPARPGTVPSQAERTAARQ